jgi:hypothetical protein
VLRFFSFFLINDYCWLFLFYSCFSRTYAIFICLYLLKSFRFIYLSILLVCWLSSFSFVNYFFSLFHCYEFDLVIVLFRRLMHGSSNYYFCDTRVSHCLLYGCLNIDMYSNIWIFLVTNQIKIDLEMEMKKITIDDSVLFFLQGFRSVPHALPSNLS